MIWLFCFGKAIYRSNDESIKANDDHDLCFGDVVALKRRVWNGSSKSRNHMFLNFSHDEELTVSDLTTLSIEIIEYASLQNNYFWNYNSFIRR